MLRPAVVALALALSIAPAASRSSSSVSIGPFKFDFSDPGLAPSTPAQKRFLAEYRSARALADPAVMRRLVHPASIACMKTPISTDYFARRMTKEVETALPVDANVIFVPVAADHDILKSLPGAPDVTTLPIVPTAFFAIDYAREEFDAKGVLLKSVGATIIRQLAQDGDDLRMVEYCLTPKGEDMFAKKNAPLASPR